MASFYMGIDTTETQKVKILAPIHICCVLLYGAYLALDSLQYYAVVLCMGGMNLVLFLKGKVQTCVIMWFVIA